MRGLDVWTVDGTVLDVCGADVAPRMAGWRLPVPGLAAPGWAVLALAGGAAPPGLVAGARIAAAGHLPGVEQPARVADPRSGVLREISHV